MPITIITKIINIFQVYISVNNEGTKILVFRSQTVKMAALTARMEEGKHGGKNNPVEKVNTVEQWRFLRNPSRGKKLRPEGSSLSATTSLTTGPFLIRLPPLLLTVQI